MLDLLLKFVLMGAATYYSAAEGDVLYCNHRMPEAVYSMDTGPWVAIDVGQYGHFADCGDWLMVRFDDAPVPPSQADGTGAGSGTGGTIWRARALDAGRLAGWEVDTTADGQRDTGLVIDIPDMWRPDDRGSWAVTVVNLTKLNEAYSIDFSGGAE